MMQMHNKPLHCYGCFQMVESDLVAARQADRSLNPQDLSRLVSDYTTCIAAFCSKHIFIDHLSPNLV